MHISEKTRYPRFKVFLIMGPGQIPAQEDVSRTYRRQRKRVELDSSYEAVTSYRASSVGILAT